MHVPNEMVHLLVERGRTLIAEVRAVNALNRAWVRFDASAGGPDRPEAHRETLEKPDSPLYVLYRFEIAKKICEDEDSLLHEADYFEHTAFHRTQDIHEAFAKAAEYEPDWSKWGTYADHPFCP